MMHGLNLIDDRGVSGTFVFLAWEMFDGERATLAF
jgi:hypothetical protein